MNNDNFTFQDKASLSLTQRAQERLLRDPAFGLRAGLGLNFKDRGTNRLTPGSGSHVACPVRKD
jgi:hypothetical protein